MNNLSCNLIELVVLTIPKTQKNENVASCEKKIATDIIISCTCLIKSIVLGDVRTSGDSPIVDALIDAARG